MKYDRRDPRCLYVYTCTVCRETYMKYDRRGPRCLYVYTCMVCRETVHVHEVRQEGPQVSVCLHMYGL